jgi:plastocyanin
MSSSILNQTYSSSFIQAKLPYNGAVSTDFPLTVEPSFIEFDPVTDFWEVQVGDEIRFENNENLTFTVSSILVNPTLDKNVNSNLIENKLRVVVTPPFEYTGSDGNIIVNQPSNFDFFVVRRYKENKNFIILDQQMPYGITSGSIPVSPSSSPGLLLTEYRVDKFNVNPDLVLKDLIEKGIVS